MTEALATATIRTLRRMTPARAEAALCALRADDQLAIGNLIGIRLPPPGDDPAETILAALFGREG